MFNGKKLHEVKLTIGIFLLVCSVVTVCSWISNNMQREEWQSKSKSYDYLYNTGEVVYKRENNNYVKSVVKDIYNDKSSVGPRYQVVYGTAESYTVEIVNERDLIREESVIDDLNKLEFEK